jgi:hypothetical protein
LIRQVLPAGNRPPEEKTYDKLRDDFVSLAAKVSTGMPDNRKQYNP